MPATAVRIPAATLYEFTLDALGRVGVRPDVAEDVAHGLWITSLRGIDSHGVRLLPHYTAAVEAGRINPDPQFRFERTTPSTGILDADHAHGHAAGAAAMRHAVELAAEVGSGQIAIRHSTHCGSLASFTLPAAEADMVGMSMTHATARLRSPGGKRAFFGNNPMCWVAPMQEEAPFCYDSAMTAYTFNKVKLYRERGETLPPGVVADEAGRETTDPHAARQLLPIGDYKGFGFAMVVDVHCALLTGMPAGREVSNMYGESLSDRRNLGQFVAATRIDAFQPAEHFRRRLQEVAEEARREPALDPDEPVRVPGDPEKQAEAERRSEGVPFGAGELQPLNELAAQLGIEPLERRR